MTKPSKQTTETREAEELHLVERLRQHRGRLTRRELVGVAGFDPRSRYHYQKINKLIAKFEIAVAPSPSRADPTMGPNYTEVDRQKARDNLAFEVSLAKAERRTAPPYRLGALEW